MSSETHEPLFGPNQLLKAIETFSDSVTQYLLPVIRFVGHKDAIFDDLNRRYSGLIHEKRYSGHPAHLVIFDPHSTEDLHEQMLGQTDSAYIFCVEKGDATPRRHWATLRHRVSITLEEPSLEEIQWHAKALLMIQDLSFSNELKSYPDLISIDVDFRRAISTLIAASLTPASCYARVHSDALCDTLVSFLFDSLPSLLQPFRLQLSTVELEKLPKDRLSLAVVNTAAQLRVMAHALDQTTQAGDLQPIMLLALEDDKAGKPVPLHKRAVRVTNLRARHADALLIAYWCAAYQSAQHRSINYYSSETIDTCLASANHDPTQYLAALLQHQPDQCSPPAEVIELVTRYDRLSIDDILDEAQQQVMLRLREASPIVDAASAAAGIPKVTFHKRLRRLGDKQSLPGLLATVKKAR